MRIAVTGKHGQVVYALLERGPLAGVDIMAVGRPELDLADRASIHSVLSRMRPDVIVSAAAYTAVDSAEQEADLAFAVNAVGPAAIGEVAAVLGIPVIHLSTDYVFSGEKPEPYVETDPTGPISIYGQSKLAGEEGISRSNPNHVILRTAWIYSPFGTNFVKTMLRLAETRKALNVVADQHGTPTSALDIADAVITIAKRLATDPDPKLRGVFHMAGGGEATWAEFAEAIFEYFLEKRGKAVTVERITTAEYPTPAKRPANSRLSTCKLNRAFGIALPDWRLSTKVVLDRLLQ